MKALFYALVISIPGILGLVVWQSGRYADLERSVKELEAAQVELLEDNKRLIAEIATLSSAERIEQIAKQLGLTRKPPENVMQVRIEGRRRSDG